MQMRSCEVKRFSYGVKTERLVIVGEIIVEESQGAVRGAQTPSALGIVAIAAVSSLIGIPNCRQDESEDKRAKRAAANVWRTSWSLRDQGDASWQARFADRLRVGP